MYFFLGSWFQFADSRRLLRNPKDSAVEENSERGLAHRPSRHSQQVRLGEPAGRRQSVGEGRSPHKSRTGVPGIISIRYEVFLKIIVLEFSHYCILIYLTFLYLSYIFISLTSTKFQLCIFILNCLHNPATLLFIPLLTC